jgi:hypothetical protein
MLDMKKALILLLCLGLCGCATTAKYEAKLNTFIGQSEDSLIASWGVPDKQYNMSDGKKAIEYVEKSTVRTGGDTYTESRTTYHSGTIGDKTYSGTSTQYVTEKTPVERYKLYCKTSFIIDKSGRVESWHHEGNDCVSE